MSIGNQIHHYRESKGMSLQDVANFTKVSRYSIFRYENGSVTNIPQENIEAIARCLNVKPCTLCEWDSRIETCNSKATYTVEDLYEALAERIPLTTGEIKSALAFAISMKGEEK